MVQTRTLITMKLQKEEGLKEPEILLINQFTGMYRQDRVLEFKVIKINTLLTVFT